MSATMKSTALTPPTEPQIIEGLTKPAAPSVVVDVAELRKVLDDGPALLAIIEAKAPVTAEDYEARLERIGEWKTVVDKLEEMRLARTRPLDVAKANDMSLFRALAGRHAEAIVAETDLLKTYRTEEKRKADERQRLENERAEKERTRLTDEAAKAEGKGRAARAENLQERAAAVLAPTVAPAVPKVTGATFPLLWKWRVKDQAAIPREFMTNNDTMIGGVVRSMHKAAEKQIPGIEVYSEENLTSKRKK